MSTMLLRGRIHSPQAPAASAMLVVDGAVAWIGDDTSAASMTASERIDLDGALVVPAFVDAHFHATGTGLALAGLDLGTAPTLADALAAVGSYAKSVGGRPIIGSGWDETDWPERRPPTAPELDRASYGGVVYLSRTDAHSAVASSSLMAAVPNLAGLDGYAPSGLLTREAHHAVRAVALAAITTGQRAQLQRTALEAAAAAGIAAVHEMAGPEISSADDLAQLLSLCEAEQLPRVFGFWGELNGVAAAQELGAVNVGGDLFCDGSIGSHTAALHEPYQDEPTSGYLRFGLGELVEHLLACTTAGLPSGFHAIGDAAIELVVQAMLEAESRLGGGRVSGAGHRIEHAELIPDVFALARAGLTASMQPAFDARWGGSDGMYADRLGADRAAGMNQFAQLAAAGVPLAFGSDSPVTPPQPWAAVRAAVYPSNPAHALPPSVAFAAHTRGGWRAVRTDSGGTGVLVPGTPATYAIFRAGEGPAASGSLPDLEPGVELPRCLQTVLDGRVIFDSGEV